MVIQEAYSQRPIADNPIPVVLWRQPHWLTPESLAEVDLIPSPLDLSVGADLPHRHSDLVVRSRYPAGIGPERRTVPIPRTGLPQSLMRPLFIVAVAKGVKGSLLPSSVRLRRRSRLCLQRPVQPLQPSVLFRVAGLDSLRMRPLFMMPSLIHHIASCDRLPRPTLAKGGPLSLRIVWGSPYSLKARSRTLCT